MDLMATAQLLGNFGEFFGAIAVVATLIYLAAQVKQAKHMAALSARESRNNGTRELFLALATSDRLADAWTRAENQMPGDALLEQRKVLEARSGINPEDAQRVQAFAVALFYHYRTMFTADLSVGDRASLDSNIRRFFSSSVGANLLAAQSSADEFVNHAKSLIRSSS